MRKYKRIAGIALAATLTASLFAGCQKSPNKDMDNMIEQAQDTQAATTEVAEVAKDYDTYQTDIKDDSLHVTVHADAQVDIPDTSQLSIFRVKQMQFDQTFLDLVRTTFFGDQALYDGTCMQQQTKASIEAEIQTYKDMITDTQNNNLYSDDGKQGYIDEYQSHIDELQEKYETTPESVDYQSYPSDNQIHSIADLSANDPSNGYYTWQNSFDAANASIYYAMNDGKNGSYQTIYLQNNENYGNLIRYRSSKLGYIDVGSSVIGEESFSESMPQFQLKKYRWKMKILQKKIFAKIPRIKQRSLKSMRAKKQMSYWKNWAYMILNIIMADLSVKQPVIIILPVRQKQTRHTHIGQSMHSGISAVSMVSS